MVKGCKPATQTPGDRLGFLLAAAAWQDSLLQAYRTMLLTSQALLLGIGTGLFVAELAMKSQVQVYVVSSLVVVVALGGSRANWRLQRVVRTRSTDVDFWHEEILECERALPLDGRAFTWFKDSQLNREEGRPPNNPRRKAVLKRRSIPELTSAGLGYTRNVIDRQVARILLGGWGLLAFGALGYTTAVAIAGVPS
jgi:hypothetical protein